MDRKTAAKEVKSRYADYLQPAKKKVGGKPTYVCPLCGNGTGSTGDGMSIDPHGDGTQLKCFKCGFYGDVIDLYQQEHKCDAGEAFRALYERFGIKIDRAESPQSRETDDGKVKPLPAPETAAEGQIDDVEAKPDFTEYYKGCKEHITDPKAQEYLAFRGLSPETAARFG